MVISTLTRISLRISAVAPSIPQRDLAAAVQLTEESDQLVRLIIPLAHLQQDLVEAVGHDVIVSARMSPINRDV